MKDQYSILLAEDDETDVLLLKRALRDAGVVNPVHVANDGQEAIDFLAERQHAPSPQDRMPAVVILDLKMPRLTGLDVLRWIRGEPGLRGLPAFVFSSSADQQDVERAFAAGATGFLVKSSSTSERIECARVLKSWLHFNQPPLACTEGFRAAQSAYLGSQIGPAPH